MKIAKVAVGWAALAAVVLVGPTAPSTANETDQFLMPDKTFADLGPMMNAAHYRALQAVVSDTNRRIDAATKRGDEEALAWYHSPAYLAGEVHGQFGVGFFEMMSLENAVRTRGARTGAGEGRITAYRNPTWIYFLAHLPFDPRNVVLLMQSSTILVDDVYMGVDKWGHFHDLGNIYFQDYQSLLDSGHLPGKAQRAVVHRYSRGLISESAVIGCWATGVQSNGDLAANFAGFKFYDNLTREVTFNRRRLEPLLIRVGRYWALNTHVRPDRDFMRPFVTDHWNEALNPGRIEIGMRPVMKLRLREHAQQTLAFYSRDNRPADSGYYQWLEEQLKTFNGEDYGHLAISPHEITIAHTCFPGQGQQPRMVRQD